MTADHDLSALGIGADEAVGITDGEWCNADIAVGNISRAVADRIALCDGMDVRNDRFQRHDGLDRKKNGFLRRRKTVQLNAEAHHVQMHPGEIRDRGGIARMAERRFHTACCQRVKCTRECGKLRLGHGRGGRICLCEVREDALNTEIADGAECIHAVGIVRGESQTVHAGVDFDMDVQYRILRQNAVELVIADGIAQSGGVVRGKYGLADVVADQQIGVCRQCISEDQDADVIAVVCQRKPHLFRFCDGGDREKVGTCRSKRSCTLPGSVSVGICLDDTADAAVGHGSDRIEIVNQMFKADACLELGFSLL